jgi:ESCRT-II complex subunit VPS22
MKRGVGVSAVQKKKTEAKQFQAVGRAMEETRLSNVKETLEQFKVALSKFAEKHRNKINSDPEFRLQFHTMCVNVGVGL